MLINLKAAIRKKKYYFITAFSNDKRKKLENLVAKGLISSFVNIVTEKRQFVIVFLGYCPNLSSSIVALASKKTSNYSDVKKQKYNNYNFVINANSANKFSRYKNVFGSLKFR